MKKKESAIVLLAGSEPLQSKSFIAPISDDSTQGSFIQRSLLARLVNRCHGWFADRGIGLSSS
jgi:hypothetical protein